MRILVVCQYYRPEEFRINEICEALASEGHSVTVLTGLPNYPSGKVPNEYRWGRKRSETLNGVRVLRSPEVGRGQGAMRLALNYASFAVSGSIRALRLRDEFDVIFVYQLSPVTMALPALVAKKRLGAPLFLYCLDLWPESLRNIVSNEKSLLYRVTARLSTHIYSKCESIGITSRPFSDYFTEVHQVPADRMVYIPQHAEGQPAALPGVRTGTTNFVFTGNLGIAQDIECILRAAQLLAQTKRSFQVHLVGDGSYAKTAKALVSELSLGDVVVFHGRRSPAEMPQFYELADACLLTLKSDNWIGLTMPGKLQGYMAAGKPVLGAIGGAAQEVIKEAHCGLCVDPGDSIALAAAMKESIENPSRREEWGRNGRAYFEENFTPDIFMARLEQELQKLQAASGRYTTIGGGVK